MMIGRLATAALLVFLIGVVIGLAGLHYGDVTTRAGILLSLATLPVLIITQSQKAHHVSEEQLAAARTDGYRMGLRDVAAGLLDQYEGMPPDPARQDAPAPANRAADLTTHRATAPHADGGPAAGRHLRAVHPDPEPKQEAV